MSSGSFPELPSIAVVLVLYKRAPQDSQSLTSLLQILERCPDLAQRLSLILFDNSPEPHNVQLACTLPIVYRHEPANPGLAVAYNFALEIAYAQKRDWLLLLDQDTSLTEEFLREARECATNLADQPSVAAIVPKLIVEGVIHSPGVHFIDLLRHQLKHRRKGPGVGREVTGVLSGRLSAYNSGATLRVSALQAIGGFPTEFWLDYLDHAVFHELHTHGYTTFVLRACIGHDASQANVSAVPIWRQRNLLAAQTLFVARTSNFWDRVFYRIWLLRYSRSLWKQRADRSLYREALVQAISPQWRAASRQ